MQGSAAASGMPVSAAPNGDAAGRFAKGNPGCRAVVSEFFTESVRTKIVLAQLTELQGYRKEGSVLACRYANRPLVSRFAN
jgi:hypothetical protein